jgi:hypothetical protein
MLDRESRPTGRNGRKRMLGLMQDWPLLLHRIIDHAAAQHGDRLVISRAIEGPILRTTYADVRRRALRIAKRLERDGIGRTSFIRSRSTTPTSSGSRRGM